MSVVPFEGLLTKGLEIINKFIPDPEQKAKAESELRDALYKWDQGQLDVNKQEAASSSVFVAGWRPFIGWVCGSALAFQFVVWPIGSWASMIIFQEVLPAPPTLDNVLWELMFGMLGIGGLRTFEKLKGVARK